MKVEKGPGPENTYKIKPALGEDLRAVLRAIGLASFEQSRPVSMGWMNFDAGTTITPEQVDQFIQERDGKLYLYMDYVGGRQVKTSLDQDDNGNLEFHARLYERDRGNPEPMFERAKEILSGQGKVSMPPEIVSTRDQYKGESLDLRLKEFGYKRLPGESDIDFRKRIFPELHRRDGVRAFEFLWGRSAAEWNDPMKFEYTVVAALIFEDEKDIKYANEYEENPQDKLPS